jgi:hypothetical protein
VPDKANGRGRAAVAWSPDASLAACVGASGVVRLLGRGGELQHEVALERRGDVLAAAWDAQGQVRRAGRSHSAESFDR